MGQAAAVSARPPHASGFYVDCSAASLGLPLGAGPRVHASSFYADSSVASLGPPPGAELRAHASSFYVDCSAASIGLPLGMEPRVRCPDRETSTIFGVPNALAAARPCRPYKEYCQHIRRALAAKTMGRRQICTGGEWTYVHYTDGDLWMRCCVQGTEPEAAGKRAKAAKEKASAVKAVTGGAGAGATTGGLEQQTGLGERAACEVLYPPPVPPVPRPGSFAPPPPPPPRLPAGQALVGGQAAATLAIVNSALTTAATIGDSIQGMISGMASSPCKNCQPTGGGYPPPVCLQSGRGTQLCVNQGLPGELYPNSPEGATQGYQVVQFASPGPLPAAVAGEAAERCRAPEAATARGPPVRPGRKAARGADSRSFL